MSPGRVLIWVQHLLGIGHTRRAATLARVMQATGLEVTLASGGFPVPGLDTGGARLVQLPPTRAVDVSFKELVDESGQAIDEAWKTARRERLLALFAEVRPDVLVTELFPLGRRQLRFELLPLLDAAVAARPAPVVACSVRDILAGRPTPEREAEILDRIDRYYDHVLVHGDPAFVALDRTFPQAGRIGDKLHYTGYVVDGRGRRRGPGADGWREVLVSAGGGAVGDRLLRAAIAARPRTVWREVRWRVLVGANATPAELAALRAGAGDGVVVEPARDDFPDLLMSCAVSVGQAGYNTTMEAIRAGCRIVAVPFAAGDEREQTLRAEALAERGVLQVVHEAELTPETLAQAIDAARPAAGFQVDLDGAAASARLVAGWCRGR
jgi:predicted glycosyltransferase